MKACWTSVRVNFARNLSLTRPGFRSRLSRRGWLSPSCSNRSCRLACDTFSRLRYCKLYHFGRRWPSRFDHGRLSRFRQSWPFCFDHDLNRSRQLRLGLLSSAMVALMQQLDAVGFFVRPQLSFFTASAFVLEVFRNRFGCHGRSVAEASSSKLSNYDHSMPI